VVDAWLAGDRATAARRYASLRVQAVEPLVLERTQRLTVVQASFGWSDLGSWTDVRDARLTDGEADADGNVVEGDVVITSSRDCTVVARSGRVVALVGGDGLVVVDTPDAVLVIPASCSQLVKQVVEHLDAEGRDELL
jgi:mannose-1-phosphate guanylyltransferase